MEWQNFEESTQELPEVVLEKLIAGFSAATKDLVQLSISPLSDMEHISSKLKSRFQFNVYLTSKQLSDYSFKVFQFGYSVSLYPVSIIISTGIIQELKSQQGLSEVTVINDEEELQQTIKLIFNTNKFKEIVGGLMKIARQRRDTFQY